jgi:hypothetical protein
LFNGGGTAIPKFVNSSTDYLNKVKPFNDAIKAVDPNAKTAIAYSTRGNATWDQNIKAYANPFWDAIVWHTYEANDDSETPPTLPDFTKSMENGNYVLPLLRSRIDSNYLANSNINPIPMIQNELDVRVSGPLYATEYNAVYNAEGVMRLTTAPEADTTMLTATGGLPLWAVDAANSYTDLALDKWEKNATFDSTSVDHGLYYKLPGLASKIIYAAINNSMKRWDATVTGGTTVTTMDEASPPNFSTAPALYATAYKGDFNNNNKNYVLITNKSDSPHTVTIKMNNTTVTAPLTVTYITSSDPQTQNNRSNPTAVQIQSASSSNPVTVPPYSVMRVEWSRSDALTVPTTTRVTSATVGNNSTTLKWWPIDGATGYKIKYGTTSGSYATTIDVGNVTTYTVTGLSANTNYYLTAVAYNSAGDSANTNEVNIKTAVPATPTVTRAVGLRNGQASDGTVTDGQAQVEWKSVTNATGYKVKYGTTSGGPYTTTIDAGDRLGMLIDGLTPGTNYYFVVTAYNGKGESAASSELSAQPRIDTVFSPNNLRTNGGSSTSAVLNWDPSYVPVLSDYFEDGSTSLWTVTKGTWALSPHPDNGTTRDTHVYESTSTGGLAQTNAGDSTWSDYYVHANVEVSSWNSTGTVSILGRYTDDDNYYRFVYDNGDQQFKLILASGGTFTTLQTVDLSYLQAEKTFEPLDTSNMDLIMDFHGSTIDCYLNNSLILSANDSTFGSGKIALASNAQQAMFDKVFVYTGTLGTPAITYNVYRSTSAAAIFKQYDSTLTPIATGLTSPSYTNTGLTPGTTYYYKVTAVRSGKETQENSNVLTVVK